ncbi:MAG: purple acid phosphatase family protein [Armatimonadota bacterium]
MKRISLLPVVLALCLVIGWPLVGRAAGSGATTTPDHLTLTWTGDAATTMTITWRTVAGITSGYVQYEAGIGLTGSALQAQAIGRPFTTDLGPARLFSVTLAELTPNTRYAYRVGDGEHWSSTHTFLTADPQASTVKFLVFSDSQSVAGGSAPYGQWRTTLRQAFMTHPDARFFIGVGDLVDTGQSGAHWNAWFAAAAGVIDTIPILPVVGNHETYPVIKGGTGVPTYYNAQFRLPQNGPKELKNQAYSVDYGPLHFVMLDSQYGEQKRAGDLLALQRRWLDADLRATNATWKIASFHKGPYGLKGSSAQTALRKSWCPVLEQRHVDLVFSAHDHGVARTAPLKNGVAMPTPSAGTVYVTTGRSGTKTYHNIAPLPVHRFFYNPLDQPNYLVVEATATTLNVQAVKQDGTLIDAFTIDKVNNLCE